jgi:hypothetical protein
MEGIFQPISKKLQVHSHELQLVSYAGPANRMEGEVTKLQLVSVGARSIDSELTSCINGSAVPLEAWVMLVLQELRLLTSANGQDCAFRWPKIQCLWSLYWNGSVALGIHFRRIEAKSSVSEE